MRINSIVRIVLILDITKTHKEYLNTRIFEQIKEFELEHIQTSFKRYVIHPERRRTTTFDLGTINAELKLHRGNT